MMRLLRQSVLWGLLLGAAGSGQAFSLLGPYMSWQVGAIGYALLGDIGGPMEKSAYYRWNVPDVYYAFDSSFTNYFGPRGMQAVDEAFGVLNAVPPASYINLNNYPQTDMLRENYQAAALGLFDVKSLVLGVMMEELGLADPIRFTWTLRLKQPVTGPPPYTNYAVIKLNYDPDTLTPSSFVNGFLMSYRIYDPVGPAPLDYADAVELSVDAVPSFASGNPTPVASSSGGLSFGPGLYWAGLTRDDVGGLRYLLYTGNIKVESVLPGTLVAITNRAAQLLLTNYDLGTFIFRTTHTTNDTATIQGYYPDAVIARTNTVLEPHTNILSYFTNAPLENCTPYPLCLQVTNTNATASVSLLYDYTMANAVTNIIVAWQTNLVNGTNVITTSSNATVYFIASNMFGYDFVVNQTNFIADLETVTNFATGDSFIIDTRAPGLVNTTNLALFNELARTNSPAQLLTIFPDLLILDSAYTITNAAVTNYFSYLTNPPYAPAGTIMPAFVEQVTNVLVTNYTHRFGNVITNTLFTNSPVSVQRLEVYRPPFQPAGTNVTTNVSYRTYYSNVVNGSLYIIPTNLVGYQIIAPLLTNYFTITNPMIPSFFGTNQFGTNQVGTNIVTTNALVYTNISLLLYGTNYTFSVYPMQRLFGGTSAVPIVTFSTNIISLVYPIEFLSSTNNFDRRLGMEKINFHRLANYDSMTATLYVPLTNTYVGTILTNDGPQSVMVTQTVRRIIGQPDIVLVADDLGFNQFGYPRVMGRSSTTNWINDDALNGQTVAGGPGVISPPVQITFNNLFPVYINQSPSLLDELSATSFYVWGSFDGTTNAPVVYPSGWTLEQLQSIIFNPPPPP